MLHFVSICNIILIKFVINYNNMPKAVIDLDDLKLNVLERIAILNKRKKTKPELVNLAFEIAIKVIENLDSESFEQVINLKK